MAGNNYLDIKPEIVEHLVKEEPIEYIVEENQFNVNNEIPGTECREVWTKLRNAYTNARKRRQTKSGYDAKNFNKWKFEEIMDFLQPTKQSRKTSGNFSYHTDSDDERFSENINENVITEDSMSHDILDNVEVTPLVEDPTNTALPSLTPAPQRTAQISTNTPSTSQRRQYPSSTKKRRFIKTSMNTIVQTIKDNRRARSQLLAKESSEPTREKYCALDETEMLFLSLGRNIKKLSPLEQARVKMEVSNIVFQAEYCELQQPSNNNQLISHSVPVKIPSATFSHSSASSSPISSPVSHLHLNSAKGDNFHSTTSNSPSSNSTLPTQFLNL